MSLPAAVTRGYLRCIVEYMRRLGEHQILPTIVMTYVMQYCGSRRRIQ
jgi:hypothetical protein